MSPRRRHRIVARALGLLGMLCACGGTGEVSDIARGSQAGSSGVTPVAGEPVAGSAGMPAIPAANVSAIFEGGCATETARAELLPSNVLFVIDRSSSMACNPPPTTTSVTCEQTSKRDDARLPSKWEIVRASFRNALAGLPDSARVGVSYFSNNDMCGVHSRPSVPIAELTDVQRSAIDVSLSNVQPSGGTPLVGATILAYRHLHMAALAGELPGNAFVVLLTDGEQSETCFDAARCTGAEQCTEQLITSEVPKAAGPGVGIKTFVIGAPGSEPARRVLSRIALAGATAPVGCSVDEGTCHFDMTLRPEFGLALSDALTKIGGRTLSCELPVPRSSPSGVDRTRLNVVYSPGSTAAPQLIFKDDRAECDAGANGWQYADGGNRIRLCGPICSQVRSDSGARVDVVLGCPARVPE